MPRYGKVRPEKEKINIVTGLSEIIVEIDQRNMNEIKI